MKKGFKLQNVKWLYATLESNNKKRVLIPYTINPDGTKVKFLRLPAAQYPVRQLHDGCTIADIYNYKHMPHPVFFEEIKAIKTLDSYSLLRCALKEKWLLDNEFKEQFLYRHYGSGPARVLPFKVDNFVNNTVMAEEEILELSKKFEKLLIKKEKEYIKNKRREQIESQREKESQENNRIEEDLNF